MADVASEMVERQRLAALEYVITVNADALTTASVPTYSITIKAPGSTEVVLTGQTAAQVATSIGEFTTQIATIWG